MYKKREDVGNRAKSTSDYVMPFYEDSLCLMLRIRII